MPETKAEVYSGSLETALFDLVRRAVRAEIREISKIDRNEDQLLTIEQVVQTPIGIQRLGLSERKKIRFDKKTGTKDGSVFGDWPPEMVAGKRTLTGAVIL